MIDQPNHVVMRSGVVTCCGLVFYVDNTTEDDEAMYYGCITEDLLHHLNSRVTCEFCINGLTCLQVRSEACVSESVLYQPPWFHDDLQPSTHPYWW